jgi:hypothetical protein
VRLELRRALRADLRRPGSEALRRRARRLALRELLLFARVALRVRAAARPGLRRGALRLEDGPLIELAQARDRRERRFALVARVAAEGVALELERHEARHASERREDADRVRLAARVGDGGRRRSRRRGPRLAARADAAGGEEVVREVEARERRAAAEVRDRARGRERVFREDEGREARERVEPFDAREGVAREVERLQRRERGEAGADARDEVRLEEEAAELREVLESANFVDPVGIEPERLEVRLRFEVFDAAEAGLVELELVVQLRRLEALVLDRGDCGGSERARGGGGGGGGRREGRSGMTTAALARHAQWPHSFVQPTLHYSAATDKSCLPSQARI